MDRHQVRIALLQACHRALERGAGRAGLVFQDDRPVGRDRQVLEVHVSNGRVSRRQASVRGRLTTVQGRRL